MSIDVQFEVKADYVYLRCRGTFKLKAVLEVYEKAFRVAAQESRKAVLVDGRDLEGEPPTTMERYEQGVYLAEHNPLRILIAVVGKEPMVERRRFGETVGRNRGATGQAFTDLDEAIAWLKEMVGE